MKRANGWALAGVLLAVLALWGWAGLAKGGLFIGKYEGDTLHLVEIMTRIAAGERPHVDFMTPLGALAFAPVALFQKLGFGLGQAMLAAQALVAALLLPAAWYVGRSRFPGPLAYGFGAAVPILCLAIVHGGAEPSVSISMHYNRWAWAVSFLLIPLAVMAPPGRPAPRVEGALIGLGLSVLALTKITYAVAFAPPVLLALGLRKARRAAVAALVAGLVPVLGVTLWAGPGVWPAYLGDLVAVAGSAVRPHPGEALGGVIGAPDYKLASLLLVLAVVALRQAGRAREGLVLALMIPGFFYVTYQNFGNDPKWVLLLALMLVALRPEDGAKGSFGLPLAPAMGAAGVALMAIAAPSWLNMAQSPFSHLKVDPEGYVALVPGQPDLRLRGTQAYRVQAREDLGEAMVLVAAVPEAAETLAGLADWPEFDGARVDACALNRGLVGWFAGIGQELEAQGLAGKRVMAADILNGYWMYSALERPEGGAPWYYGGLPGIESADYLLVPRCTVQASAKVVMLSAVREAGVALRLVRETPLYRLYALDPMAAASSR